MRKLNINVYKIYFCAIYYAKMGTIKDRNGTDLTDAEDIRTVDKNTWKTYTKKKILMTQIIKIV